MPTIELLPTSSAAGSGGGGGSWFYSTAAPKHNVAAMPTASDLRVRKAKQTKDGLPVESASKKDIAAQKRIAELEKVNYRDVVIKVSDKRAPTRGKTANTRKILASQKTFGNYLADGIALNDSTRPHNDDSLPLSYTAAQAAPPKTNATANRHFCELCGYWGVQRCMKCATRLCEEKSCAETHRETRCARQFA